MTNVKGNSPTTRKSATGTVDGGLRTLSGGQFSIQVEGNLAIQTNAAPPLVVEDAHSVRDVSAVVREAPTGAPIALRLRQDSSTYSELTIPIGGTSSNVVKGFGMPPLMTGSTLSLDVVSVGQTADSVPGADLTVTIRL